MLALSKRKPCLAAAAILCAATPAAAQDLAGYQAAITAYARASGGEIAVVAFRVGGADSVLVSPDLRFHAASTMKIPVLIELARRVDAGEFAWTDSLPVRNRFRSIVDGSPYSLDPGDDSDSSAYALVGHRASVRDLAHRMIARSSNLATNLLIEDLDPARVNRTAHQLGADSIEVRRGVEDLKAYEQGLNNTTTARDLGRLLAAIAAGRAASPGSTGEMLRILRAQEFNDGIPAGLPPGYTVAHKTGEITRIAHDAAIVYPPQGPPVILVVLTRGFDQRTDAMAHVRAIAGILFPAH